MKIYSTLASCFALLLLASCSNDEITTTPEVKTYKPVATARFGEFIDVSKPKAITKAGVIEDNPDYKTKGEQFYWANGDRVKVLFFKDDNLTADPFEMIYVADVSGGEKPKRCDFSTTSEGLTEEGTYTIYALYPADGWSKDEHGYKATMPDFTNDAHQQKADGSSTHVGAGMFMKAKSTVEIGEGRANSFDMGFKHLVAMVRVNVKNSLLTEHEYVNLLVGYTIENYNQSIFTEAYLDGGINGESLVPSVTMTDAITLNIRSNQPLVAHVPQNQNPVNSIYVPMLPITKAIGYFYLSVEGSESKGNNYSNYYEFQNNWLNYGIKAGYSYHFDGNIGR